MAKAIVLDDDNKPNQSDVQLTALTVRRVEPVGRWFEAYRLRKQTGRTLSTHSCSNPDAAGQESDTTSDSQDNDIEIKDDIEFMRSLNPKEWKDQDHYAVLGIDHVRHKATDGLVRKAYRKKVLIHHPDKRKANGDNVKDLDDDYFTCITKAYETLGTQAKRRAFDSVDPLFDDFVPPVNANSRERFYEVFEKAFRGNARWSNKKNVPLLGNEKATLEEVDRFYNFWYDFDSWREFSYKDEEEKDKGQDREERRWIEKNNKSARAKLKKEEMARIRQLVDNAYACDPRIQKFKQDEKDRKQAAKKLRQDQVRLKYEEEERARKEAEDEEKRKKEQEADRLKQQQEAAKKQKDAQKKALKNKKKAVESLCKENNYYAENESEVVTRMADLDRMFELLKLDELDILRKKLTECKNDKDEGRNVFLNQVSDLNAKLNREKQTLLQSVTQKTVVMNGTNGLDKKWPNDDMQLLIKAVNLFPAGTNQRWEVVANYMNQHSTTPHSNRNAKEVLAKAKDLQKLDPRVKEETNKNAYNKFEQEKKQVEPESSASERFESPAEQQGFSNAQPWSAEEQKILEQALKSYGGNMTDRWDKIAECLPNRSKKDCMKRYKDLVEIVKAKKAALSSVVKAK